MLPCPPLFWTPADFRGGPVRHKPVHQPSAVPRVHATSLKLLCQGCTPGFDVSPFSLSRSFLERAVPEFSAGLLAAFPLHLDASDFEGLLFIFPPETTRTFINTKQST